VLQHQLEYVGGRALVTVLAIYPLDRIVAGRRFDKINPQFAAHLAQLDQVFVLQEISGKDDLECRIVLFGDAHHHSRDFLLHVVPVFLQRLGDIDHHIHFDRAIGDDLFGFGDLDLGGVEFKSIQHTFSGYSLGYRHSNRLCMPWIST